VVKTRSVNKKHSPKTYASIPVDYTSLTAKFWVRHMAWSAPDDTQNKTNYIMSNLQDQHDQYFFQQPFQMLMGNDFLSVVSQTAQVYLNFLSNRPPV
jgi:hypothetical protein